MYVDVHPTDRQPLIGKVSTQDYGSMIFLCVILLEIYVFI